MKRTIVSLMVVMAIILSTSAGVYAQASGERVVNVTSFKTKWPEKGSQSARDSLVAIYNTNVTNKNDKILSHREYWHYYTASNKDYLIVEEYADLASMEAAGKMDDELIKKAWPDEAKRKAFFDAMEAYFEDWHGDALYHTNPKLSKN